MRRLLALLIFCLLLPACAWNDSAPAAGRAAPTAETYVLSEAGGALSTARLSLVDPEGRSLRQSVELLPSRPGALSRDPQGRLWIGYWRKANELDERVQIYGQDGKLVRELSPCLRPMAGITFAAGRAFVACAERGFGGSLAVLDLSTLEAVASIPLALPNNPLLLTSSVAAGDDVVVVGKRVVEGGIGSTVVSIIDAPSLTVRAQIDAGTGTDVSQALPYGSQVYLLNTGSWREPRGRAGDLLVLDLAGEPTLTAQPLAPAPVWGAFDGDTLYVYHNPVWNQPNEDPTRQISRLDLVSGEVTTWPLPPNWDAGDLALSDGAVLLTHWEGPDRSADGLYSFDPSDGTLAQLLQVPNPTRLLVNGE